MLGGKNKEIVNFLFAKVNVVAPTRPIHMEDVEHGKNRDNFKVVPIAIFNKKRAFRSSL